MILKPKTEHKPRVQAYRDFLNDCVDVWFLTAWGLWAVLPEDYELPNNYVCYIINRLNKTLSVDIRHKGTVFSSSVPLDGHYSPGPPHHFPDFSTASILAHRVALNILEQCTTTSRRVGMLLEFVRDKAIKL